MLSIILFEDLIKEKYSMLSMAQKKATEYIFQNLEKAAFNTAVQIGHEAGVSDSTVIRLAYALGFRSFSEMQGMIQRQIMDVIKPSNKQKTDEDLRIMNDNNPFTKIINDEVSLLNGLLEKLDITKIQEATKALIEADQVLIMGYYSAFTVANEFYLKLSLMRPNVFFYRTTETEIQRLYNLTDKSVVVAVSFTKHIKGTLKFTRQAQSQGAKIISVTESELTQISLESEIPFIVDVNADDDTRFATMSQALVLFHLIIMSIKMQNKEQVLKNLNNIYANLENEDIYL